jgi:hypothetical protein
MSSSSSCQLFVISLLILILNWKILMILPPLWRFNSNIPYIQPGVLEYQLARHIPLDDLLDMAMCVYTRDPSPPENLKYRQLITTNMQKSSMFTAVMRQRYRFVQMFYFRRSMLVINEPGLIRHILASKSNPKIFFKHQFIDLDDYIPRPFMGHHTTILSGGHILLDKTASETSLYTTIFKHLIRTNNWKAKFLTHLKGFYNEIELKGLKLHVLDEPLEKLFTNRCHTLSL